MNSKYPVLPIIIVDDQIESVEGAASILLANGIENVLPCTIPGEVLRLIEQQGASLVLLDLVMPEMSGQELLAEIRGRYPNLAVIVVTGADVVDTAVQCMQLGATDYMVKPVEESRLVSGVRHAIELWELRQEYDAFRKRMQDDHLEHPEAFNEMVTRHPKMRSIFAYIETIAATSKPVLITGESGVGKELIARAIHRLANVKGKLVAVNVAGLDDSMFADSLFGHVRGAFTGASEQRKGLIEQAAGGTLFLDEIGDISPASQVKLLRLLQEHEYFPLGADLPKRSDARVLASTNRNLEQLQKSGQFRTDLFYRLRNHNIQIPPLRERREDLPLLVDHFIQLAAASLNRTPPAPPRGLQKLLGAYDFPGNIRELDAMVFEAVSTSPEGALTLASFQRGIQFDIVSNMEFESDPSTLVSFSPARLPTLREAREQLIGEALRRSKHNLSIASDLLGITRPALSQWLKRSVKSGKDED